LQRGNFFTAWEYGNQELFDINKQVSANRGIDEQRSDERGSGVSALYSPQVHALSEGQMFEGRFQIISILGQGGVGVVYKAKQLGIDRVVALKTLQQNMVSTESSLKRFEQEARAVSNLAHPNIVTIHDFGRSADGIVFLVMEYLGNQTLDGLIKAESRLHIDRFLKIFYQICDGLQHAHKKGIIHRDMKPSNIMLVSNDEGNDFVKIVDFGLAKLAESDSQQHLTKTGAVLGTPLFMSPEQCKGIDIDHRSDIYSVGCMMYFALTGRVPFQGDSPLNTFYKHLSESAAPFSISAPALALPPQLELVVLRALQKDPDQRQQSMAALKGELINALYPEAYQLSHPSASHSGWHPESTGRSNGPSNGLSNESSRNAELNPQPISGLRQNTSAAIAATGMDPNPPTLPDTKKPQMEQIRSQATTIVEQKSIIPILLTTSITCVIVALIGATAFVLSSKNHDQAKPPETTMPGNQNFQNNPGAQGKQNVPNNQDKAKSDKRDNEPRVKNNDSESPLVEANKAIPGASVSPSAKETSIAHPAAQQNIDKQQRLASLAEGSTSLSTVAPVKMPTVKSVKGIAKSGVSIPFKEHPENPGEQKAAERKPVTAIDRQVKPNAARVNADAANPAIKAKRLQALRQATEMRQTGEAQAANGSWQPARQSFEESLHCELEAFRQPSNIQTIMTRARILECWLHENKKNLPGWKHYLTEVLNPYNNDRQRITKAIANKDPDASERIFMPLGWACLELAKDPSELGQDSSLYAQWSAYFYKQAIDCWQNSPAQPKGVKYPRFRNLVLSYIEALRSMGATDLAEKTRNIYNLPVPPPKKPNNATTGRVHSVTKKAGRMRITEFHY
jgi:serine/threonine protein kinase